MQIQPQHDLCEGVVRWQTSHGVAVSGSGHHSAGHGVQLLSVRHFCRLVAEVDGRDCSLPPQQHRHGSPQRHLRPSVLLKTPFNLHWQRRRTRLRWDERYIAVSKTYRDITGDSNSSSGQARIQKGGLRGWIPPEKSSQKFLGLPFCGMTMTDFDSWY